MAEQLLGIRKYLQDQGYGDNDIGYSNGNVTLKGQNLIQATPQAQTDLSKGLYQSSTYASPTALAAALQGYQNTYGKPQTSVTDPSSRNNLLNSTYNNVNSAVNTQTPFEFKQQQSPFSYDANSDVQYQNALKNALANAQVASNNAQSQLGSRGIGNSSIASNMANQIQQKSIGDVTTNVLPQLIQQAYQRYQDQNNNDYRNQVANYGVGQDQIRNQSAFANALNGLNQQDFSNQLANKESNLNAAVTIGNLQGRILQPKDDWSNLYNQSDAPLSLAGRTYEDNLAQQGVENTRADKQLNATLANMTSDNARAAASEARAAGNQQLGQLFDIWDRTGVAPAGIPGVAAGTKLAGKNGASGGVDMAAEIDGLLGSLRSGKLTPTTALQQLEEDFSVGHYTKPEYDQLKATIAKLAPSYSAPVTELPKEQQNAIPSDAQLDKLVPKGAPALDWKSWYKDPRGRSAGVNFENWQTLYGPRILAK